MKNLTLTCLAALLLQTSCKVADMQQNPELVQNATELPVIGRKTISLKKDFHLGSYAVTNVKRGWTRSSGFSGWGLTSKNVSQRFEFVLRDSAGTEAYVTCQAGVNAQEVQLGKIFSIGVGGDAREVFVSTIPAPSGGAWQLITKDPGRDITFTDFQGVLKNGDQEIRVEPVYDYQSKHRTPSQEILGYEFKAGQDVLGAVQVNGKGRVWLKNGLPPAQQQVLSSAAVSLLLYQKLNKPAAGEPQNAKVKLPLSLLN